MRLEPIGETVDELAEKLAVARNQVRIAKGVIRTLTHVLADLEDALEAQPKEAQPNGRTDRHHAHARERVEA